MTGVGQVSIQSAPFSPDLGEEAGLVFVFADVAVEEGGVAAQFCCEGAAGFLLDVAAGYEPAFVDQMSCKSFSDTGLRVN